MRAILSPPVLFTVLVSCLLSSGLLWGGTSTVGCRSYYEIKDVRTCLLSGNGEETQVKEEDLSQQELGAPTSERGDLAPLDGPPPAEFPGDEERGFLPNPPRAFNASS